MSRSATPLLEVENLRKHYMTEGAGLLGRGASRIRAVDGISFTVNKGETVGLVGESGCGKSTAGTTLLRLEEPTLYPPETDKQTNEHKTRILFEGEDVAGTPQSELKEFRRRARIIFQDPTSSFDPRRTVEDSIAEPLEIHGISDRDQRRAITEDILSRVGLDPETADSYPHELSGGQKQRVALARALVVNPDFIVADEPVSALDVSVQANIINLLTELQDEFNIGLLFISHDMGVIRQVCDRVAVMYLGEIVEIGPTGQVFNDPRHPYTRALMSAVPRPDPRFRDLGVELSGDVPAASDPPTGCRFHTRCPEVIPPEGVDIERNRWSGLMHFADHVRRGQVRPAEIRENLAKARGNGTAPEDISKQETRAAIEEEFSLPAEDDQLDQHVAGALEQTVEALVDGDLADAQETLDETFVTPCASENPELVEVGSDHKAACHLNDPEIDAEPVFDMDRVSADD